jgi:hypothetical protein
MFTIVTGEASDDGAEVEIIVIKKSNIYDWIMVEIFELRVLANI